MSGSWLELLTLLISFLTLTATSLIVEANSLFAIHLLKVNENTECW